MKETRSFVAFQEGGGGSRCLDLGAFFSALKEEQELEEAGWDSRAAKVVMHAARPAGME